MLDEVGGNFPMFISVDFLNGIIKNQQIRGSFTLGLPFHKSMRDKHLSKLLPLLQSTLYVVIPFVQFLNALSCNPIHLIKCLKFE